MSHYLAFDLGAESGRAMLGTLSAGKLQLEELYRFPNSPVRLPTGFYWDTLRLWHDIQQGLVVAGRERKIAPQGIGVDTWGVDFGLLGADGALVDNPRHYRDARNNGVLEQAFRAVPRERIFEYTGLQFMQFNSLFQLYAMKLAGSPALQTARTLLLMPDLFNYFLTGEKKVELTIASTSQCYDPRVRRWAGGLVAEFGLDPSIFPEIVFPGTRLGSLLPHVAAQAALPAETTVYATCGHDPAAAVAAVPAGEGDWCYISSGTWSLMGVESLEPVVTPQCLQLNFTNEIGAEGRIRLLKNIAGLWLLQECRRAWALEGSEYGYDQLAQMAAQAKPFLAVLPPDRFLEPGDMPRRIAEYSIATGQDVPEDTGQVCRVILEGLALRYRQVLESLESLAGRKLAVIHIVGGGSQNRLLNQLVADATRRTVIAGPSEATAAGNILVQAIGAGELSGLAELRRVVRDSFPLAVFEPKGGEGWDSAYELFCRLNPQGAA